MTRTPRSNPVRGVVTALLIALALASMGCATADALRQARFAVEDDLSVYTMNGRGDELHEVAVRTHTGETPREALWDAYFQPNLAPDGRVVACIRFRNYTRFSGNDPGVLARQSSEIVILDPGPTGPPATRVVYSLPGQAGLVYRLGAPIWSRDGRTVFFTADNRVLAHRLGTAETDTIAELPGDVRAVLSVESITSTYLRLARDGEHIFALLTEGATGTYSVWKIRWATREASRLWRGPWFGSHLFRIDRPLPAELDDDVVEALFGSREFPVVAPRFSADHRFYFFVQTHRGLFSRSEVAGYDRDAHREFTVRTLHRGIMSE